MPGIDNRDYDGNAEILYALAHPVRLQILCALKSGELAVSGIEEMTEIGQPRLSQQLAILRKTALVLTRRDGKQIHYRINRERMLAVSDMLDQLAGTHQGVGFAPEAAEAAAPSTALRPAKVPAGSAASFARVWR